MKPAKVSIWEMKKTIILMALLNCFFYIILVLIFKWLNMLHIFGLRFINYAVLTIVSLFQLHHQIVVKKGYVPFLKAFFIVVSTGSLSFFLFGVFLLIYSLFDPYLNDFYATHYGGTLLTPPILIFFEGTGASIVSALIVMLYSNRYETGEKEID